MAEWEQVMAGHLYVPHLDLWCRIDMKTHVVEGQLVGICHRGDGVTRLRVHRVESALEVSSNVMVGVRKP